MDPFTTQDEHLGPEPANRAETRWYRPLLLTAIGDWGRGFGGVVRRPLSGDVVDLFASWKGRRGTARAALFVFLLLAVAGMASLFLGRRASEAPVPALGFGPLPSVAPNGEGLRADLPGTAWTPRDLIDAAAEAATTLAREPGSLEAAYVRAVALDRLHLPYVARASWEAVRELADEPSSEARRTAELRLAEMAAERSPDARWEDDLEALRTAADAADEPTLTAIVDRNRQRVREWIEDEVLPAWADAVFSGDSTEAEHALEVAIAVTDRLTALTGDHLTADAVSALRSSTTSDPTTLALGHAAYREARRLYRAQAYSKAAPLFVLAEGELEAAGSPFSAWARLYHASCLYNTTDLAGALSELQSLGESLDAHRHPLLDAYVHWILSLVRGRLGPSVTALPDCEHARALFAAAGEQANEVAMHSTMAAILVQTADVEEAWSHLEAGLEARASLASGRHGENVLYVAIDALRASGRAAASLPLVDELVAEAEARKNPTGLALALRKRGEVLIDVGADEEMVTSDFDELEEVAVGIEDAEHRNVVVSETLIARGRFRCESDPTRGLQDLDRAESFVESSAHRHLLIQVLSERARCRRAAGDSTGADLDLDRALAEVEGQRGLIRDAQYRAFYVDQARAVQDARVTSELSQGLSEAALGTIERLRAPVLLDSLGSIAPLPDAEEVTACLPRDTALVELLSLETELVAWVIDDRGMRTLRLDIQRAELAKDVRAFRHAITAGRSPRTSRLEQRILRALLPELDGAKTVVFVPDGPLHELPFAALRDPDTNRFLVERFAIATAPSARAYCALEARADLLGTDRPRSVLAIGGVPFARRLFPRLEPLPGSRREAQAAAKAYPVGTLLLGAAATTSRFLSDAPAYDVIHVASHAVDSPLDPSAASLLLAPAADRSSDGVLPARDIRFSGPLATRLVVLAACRTAGGRISASEGPLNLARPFLAAGVPTVVATLWELDEATSLVFSERFHAALAYGMSPLDAFHSAQLALSHDPDPRLRSPRSWAGLVLIGATGGASGSSSR